jgi:CRP-like cAMP-binding protein
MMPGDSCDLHVSLLAEMDHSIQTITEATVATISQATMQEMLWKSPAISRALYSAQLIDEGTLRAWIVSMGRRSSIERVAHLMCELYIRMQNIDEETNSRVDVPVSQILFADALGMTPVHINRVLRRLREANVMNISRRSIRITDPIGLANLAGFDDNYLHRRLRTDD